MMYILLIQDSQEHAGVDDYRPHSSRNFPSCVAAARPGMDPANSSSGSTQLSRRIRPFPLALTRSWSPWETWAADSAATGRVTRLFLQRRVMPGPHFPFAVVSKAY